MLVVLGLLVGCTGQGTQVELKDSGVDSEMPVLEADVEETVVETPETQETTDLTTSDNTFDALDEAVEELE